MLEWLARQADKWERDHGAGDGVAANFRAAVSHIHFLRRELDSALDQVEQNRIHDPTCRLEKDYLSE